jgi:hypothetical protein
MDKIKSGHRGDNPQNGRRIWFDYYFQLSAPENTSQKRGAESDMFLIVNESQNAVMRLYVRYLTAVDTQLTRIIWITTIRWKGGFDATAWGTTQRKCKA